MANPGYDPRFVQAAHDRLTGMAALNCAQGMAPTPAIAPLNIVSGVRIEFLANGFLVAPQMEYLGSQKVAHVARDKDELLKLIGEMIDAHAR